MFHLTASTSEGCPNERSSCATTTTRARSSRYSTTTWSGCRRRRHRRLTYVVSPGDVTDQLHGQVHGTELSCKRLPSRWIGLSLTQHIIHEIHHVTSGNRHTLDSAPTAPSASDMVGMKRLSTRAVFLYLRQVHVLNTVVWKDGRAQTHVLGRVLFEIDQ